MRLFGSLAVFAEVSFFFMPVILAQKESRREPPCGCGGFKPGLPGLAALYDALPFAFKPPLGFLPSFLVHASLILDLLVSRHWVDGFRIFCGIAFFAHMNKRFCLVFDAELMLKLTAAIAHQAVYSPRNRHCLYAAHAASLMVCCEIIDGYRTSLPKSLLCSTTPM